MTPPAPRFAAAAVLAALPWLMPFSPGPSAAVVPWLASAACGLLLVLLAALRGARLHAALATLAAATVLLAWLAAGPFGGQEVAFLAAGLALATLAASVGDDEEIGHAVQAGLLLAAVLSAMCGLCQYFGVAAAFAPWINMADPGVAYGNLRQPNQFASLCTLGLVVLLWGSPRLPRRSTLLLAVLLATASAASVSRTALLQGLVLGALALAWPGPERSRRLQLWAAAAVAYVAASALLPWLLEASGLEPPRVLLDRLGGVEACSSRLTLWANVLYNIPRHPLLGWGWGELDYAHFSTLYRGERFCDILDNAHNLPLHLAVELGVPFALLACGGFGWWAARQRPWREEAPRRQLAWAMLAVLLLHSLLEYPLWYGPFQLALGASLGWLLARAPAGVGPRRVHLPLVATSAALLVAMGYAGWDYARVSQVYLQPEERFAPWRDDPLAHARRSWLFAGQASFAELTLASLTRANAQWMYDTSTRMLHYSPEPRVIERLIESATMLERYDEAVLHLARYRAAFPKDYAAWQAAQKRPLPVLGAP